MMDEMEKEIRYTRALDDGGVWNNLTITHLLTVIDGLREEVEEASKHVDIEIVKAEGLGKAVDICNQERERYSARLDAIEKENDGLREEVEEYQPWGKNNERFELLEERNHLNARLAAIEKAVEPIVVRFAMYDDMHNNDPMLVAVGDLRVLIAAVKGENS